MHASLPGRWIAALALLLFPSVLAGQAVMTGVVREQGTGRPLPDVEVLFEALHRRTVTDDSGRYVLSDLPGGFRTALVRRIGYHALEVSLWIGGADTVRADLTLEPTAVRLEPVEVRGNRGLTLRDGFEERRRLGGGRFIDAAELRKSEHLRLYEVLRRVQGIEMAKQGTEAYAVRSRPPRPCYLQVYLDGVLLYPKGTRYETPPSLNLFDVGGLEAVEVYGGQADTPGEFGGAGARCGTLVLWSRRGGG